MRRLSADIGCGTRRGPPSAVYCRDNGEERRGGQSALAQSCLPNNHGFDHPAQQFSAVSDNGVKGRFAWLF